MRLCIAVLALLAVAHAASPMSPDQVPKGYTEPEYATPKEHDEAPAHTEMLEVGDMPMFANPIPTPSGYRFAEQSGSSGSSSASMSSQSGSSSGSSGSGLANLNGYPSPLIPGPFFGSFAARMDAIGNSIPPYAFDPQQYLRMGPYRALTNKYSDGTSYPLNMQKFDQFPMGQPDQIGLYGSGGAPVAGAAGAAAPGASAAPVA
jgi:hypothetical protein